MSDTCKLVRASKARPCPVCGGDHKCSRTPDGGLVLCGRSAGPVPGFDHLGPAKDPTWHKYRARNAERGTRSGTRSFVPRSALPVPRFRELADEFARALTPAHRDHLAAKLGLPPDALAKLPDLGWNDRLGCWTVPECDGRGTVIGIAVRFPDGAKQVVPGGHRGLVFPAGWLDAPGPVLVVEGMSDVLALAHCGLAAIGRPSNRGGAVFLAEALAKIDPARPVIVLGENDRKPTGDWPGRDGAEAVAADMRAALPGRRVLVALPPDAYKDARDWVVDRLRGVAGWLGGSVVENPATQPPNHLTTQPPDPLAIGKDIADALARAATQAAADAAALAPHARRPGRRFKMPVPISALAAADGPSAGWVWDGYLARGAVTLFSALPKCGKTTLITHLLKALAAGGEFCGRPLLPGKAVVVSEEAEDVWADRRERLGIGDHVRLLTRPFFGKPPEEDWVGFLHELADFLAADPADLVVLDTLADLWPVRDENNATDVQTAMQPLRRLADGRAVLCVHHLRKSDGAEGTGSRGSGALAGFVDVLLELRRVKGSSDPAGVKRELKAMGRRPGIPAEWVVALDEETNEYRFAGTTAKEAGAESLRDVIRGLLPAGPPGLSRKEIWDRLPDEWRVNEPKFAETLRTGAGKDWLRQDRPPRKGGPTYWRDEDQPIGD